MLDKLFELNSWEMVAPSSFPTYVNNNFLLHVHLLADKCRELAGERVTTGEFSFLNCFDMSTGSLACVVKVSAQLYVYNLRAAHVEGIKHRAIEMALTEALAEGLSASVASKQAIKAGEKAAKRATRQANRIIGPLLSSGWDFFETMYFGGTLTEGFCRGTGTLFGAYSGGFFGEQSMGRLGYLVGSQTGSWFGGRVGLMVHDIINGVHYFLKFVQEVETAVSEDSTQENAGYDAQTVFWEDSTQDSAGYEATSEGSESPTNFFW